MGVVAETVTPDGGVIAEGDVKCPFHSGLPGPFFHSASRGCSLQTAFFCKQNEHDRNLVWQTCQDAVDDC